VRIKPEVFGETTVAMSLYPPREGHQGSLVLARQCPGSPALATQKKLAYLGFRFLDHSPYSDDFHFFFLSFLHKLEQRSKKFIELRGEYVE
jgi:hypothetical protein